MTSDQLGRTKWHVNFTMLINCVHYFRLGDKFGVMGDVGPGEPPHTIFARDASEYEQQMTCVWGRSHVKMAAHDQVMHEERSARGCQHGQDSQSRICFAVSLDALDLGLFSSSCGPFSPFPSLLFLLFFL